MDADKLRELLLLLLVRLGASPEDLADFGEGMADALRKDLSPAAAVIYAFLETKSEEMSEDSNVARMLNMDWEQEFAEDRQDVLRELFRDVARRIGG